MGINMVFFVSRDRIKKKKELQIKMSLSVQRSVVESFSFNGKNVHSVHVPDVRQCLVAKDVAKAVGYNDDDNAKRAVRTHVPEKYSMHLGDAKNVLKEEVIIDLLHPDTILLKEPGLYCFLLRCKRDEAEPFMERVLETVSPREVRKLASVIEEKDAALALLSDDLQDRENQMQAIQYENVALQAQRNVYQTQLAPSSILKHVMWIMREILVKTTLSSLCGNTQGLPTISSMTCHVMLLGYNDVKVMFN